MPAAVDSNALPRLLPVSIGFALVLAACGPSSGFETGSEGSSSEGSTASPTPTSTTQSVTTTESTAATTETTSGDATVADTTAEGSTEGPVCLPLCPSYAECNNGIDDDGDGAVDLEDVDCITPCQNDEGSADHGFVDVAGDCVVDCYFDDNTGMGDDDCASDTRCDPLGPMVGMFGCEPMPDSPLCQDSPAPSDECLTACLPLTPPGCDCFGCCTLPTPRGPEDRWLGDPACTLADPTTCPPCTQNLECVNLCDDPCEWCLGEPELPAGCAEASCERDTSCTDQCECSEGTACMQGCCRAITLQP